MAVLAWNTAGGCEYTGGDVAVTEVAILDSDDGGGGGEGDSAV